MVYGAIWSETPMCSTPILLLAVFISRYALDASRLNFHDYRNIKYKFNLTGL